MTQIIPRRGQFKMTDEEEFYSNADRLAFQRVGEFLCWFAMLETKIDESIIDLLGLNPTAGQLLLTYVPYNKKCDFFRELTALEEAGLNSKEQKEARKAIDRIRKLSDSRNMIAHSFFSGEGGAVRFMRAEKRLIVDTSKTVDDKAFRDHRTEMTDLWGWVTKISHRIKTKMNERRIAETLLVRLKIDPFSKAHQHRRA